MKRILFVESSESVRGALKLALRTLDGEWKLDLASTAQDALEQAKLETYDLVIASNKLRDKRNGGLELLNVFRANYPQTIRFLLVGMAGAEESEIFIGSPQQVLTRPLDIKLFTQQVNRAFLLRSVIRDPALFRLLGKADSLPPLPRVFEEITKALNNPNASLQDVANIISKDIVLSSKVLKLANSALFNLRMPASTVAQSVSLLGSRTISSLVFSQGMGEMFKSGVVSEQFVEEVNRHSLECATMISNILSAWNAERRLIEKAFFCGIAHDLGKLVLAEYAPEKWQQIEAAKASDSRCDTEIERDIAGISHAEIAAYLLAIWGFSNEQVLAVAFHHDPSKANDFDFGLLCALHLAENLVQTHLHGSSLDWDYLASCRIRPEDVDELKTMLQAVSKPD